MDLHSLIWTKPDSPYFRPPPLQLHVVDSIDRIRVVAWEFSDSSAKPLIKKQNKVAAISDGKTVSTITLCEEFASKIFSGKNYIVRGYALRGQSPPYLLTVTKETQFFRCAPVSVAEQLIQQGKALLHPTSTITPLSNCAETQGFITIEGEITEVSTVKKAQSGKEAIPLKNITIQRDTTQVALCLWREAAVEDLQLGSHIRVSHLRSRQSTYGLQLQSTNYTQIEPMNTNEDMITEIVGVIESETAGMVELLSSTNETFRLEENKWQPFDAELSNGPVKIKIKTNGHIIAYIEHV